MYNINLQGKESIFEQIKKQIIKFVELGVLKPGDKLPSVRSLAQDLGINPNTVQRAYALLEEEGIVYTINKKGAFVSGKDINAPVKAEEMLESLKKEGISKQDLLKLIEDVYGGEK